MEKERSLNSIIREKPAVKKPRSDAGAPPRCGAAQSKAHPGIVLLNPRVARGRPTPPRPLPDRKGVGARAAAAAASGVSLFDFDTTSKNRDGYSSALAEPEVEEEEEEDQQHEEEEEQENNYVPSEEENSFDNRDDMSEDGLGLGPSERTNEVDHVVDVSSKEEQGRGQKSKKTKGVKVGGVKVNNKEVADCWQNFEKVMVSRGDDSKEFELKEKCLHCKNEYKYVQGSSTTTLNRHMKKCKTLNAKIAMTLMQTRLGFPPSNATTELGLPVIVPSNGFDQATIKELVAKMIAVHEYSFRMVEHEWFNIVMKYLNPLYKPIGRKASRAECLRVYKAEREVLKAALKNVEYISLTTDMWTSNQTIGYMCVVAHYIDRHWRMQTRVLSFTELDPPHTGHVIADAVFECVTEWKIEHKIISITLDNASNNDGAVRDLMAMFAVRRGMAFEAEYFHVRCCAHIINLVVQDGTACLGNLITNLRETVKYFKKSPSQLHRFVEICRVLGIEIGEHLNLDVCTRWSSTYKMIKVAFPYKQALKSYAVSDANYKWAPSSKEWKLFELIEPLLFAFACVTTAFSGQAYPTSSIFYPHIVSIKRELRKSMVHKVKTYRAMAQAMMDKFNKYWEETNNVMVIATFLDPRYKMKYVAWCFGQIYDESKAAKELADFKQELEGLYEKFDARMKQSENRVGASTSKSTSILSSSMPPADCEFQAFLNETDDEPSKSELRNYIDDKNVAMDPKFDLLGWWKVNGPRYPVLAKMAKRFLTVPVSFVSSESTFSTGGRVLDDLRSSLKPYMVEALVCGASYIKGAHRDLNLVEAEEDEEEDVEKITLPKSVVDSNY